MEIGVEKFTFFCVLIVEADSSDLVDFPDEIFKLLRII